MGCQILCLSTLFFFLFFFFSPAALSGEPRQRIKSPASLSYICRSLTCAPSGCLGFLSGRQVCREYGPEATEPPPSSKTKSFIGCCGPWWSLCTDSASAPCHRIYRVETALEGRKIFFPLLSARLLLVHPCAWQQQPYYWSIIKRVYGSRPAAGGGGDWQVSGQKEETTGESRV